MPLGRAGWRVCSTCRAWVVVARVDGIDVVATPTALTAGQVRAVIDADLWPWLYRRVAYTPTRFGLAPVMHRFLREDTCVPGWSATIYGAHPHRTVLEPGNGVPSPHLRPQALPERPPF